MVNRLHLEQADKEAAVLRAQLEEQTELEEELKPPTDALKKADQESQAKAAMWKAKFEGLRDR